MIGPQSWGFSPGVAITSAMGQAAGLLAVTAGFSVAGIGVSTAAAWWAAVMLVAAGLSILVVVPWWPFAISRV